MLNPAQGWETGRLVPVVSTTAEDSAGYVSELPEEHDLMVAIRAYTLAIRRAVAGTSTVLPQHFGQVLMVRDHPYIAFSPAEWERACAATCRKGTVGLWRSITYDRPAKRTATKVNGEWKYARRAEATHLYLRLTAALPRLPRKNAYFRVWTPRTRAVRVVNDLPAGGAEFGAAYDDLWNDLARKIEELIPLALADLLRRGVES